MPKTNRAFNAAAAEQLQKTLILAFQYGIEMVNGSSFQQKHTALHHGREACRMLKHRLGMEDTTEADKAAFEQKYHEHDMTNLDMMFRGSFARMPAHEQKSRRKKDERDARREAAVAAGHFLSLIDEGLGKATKLRRVGNKYRLQVCQKGVAELEDAIMTESRALNMWRVEQRKPKNV